MRKESLDVDAFKLARTTSQDASAPRNGGMTVLLFICRSRSLWGSGQRPDGGVVRGRRRPLTAGHGVAQTPTNILFATMPPLCRKAGSVPPTPYGRTLCLPQGMTMSLTFDTAFIARGGPGEPAEVPTIRGVRTKRPAKSLLECHYWGAGTKRPLQSQKDANALLMWEGAAPSRIHLSLLLKRSNRPYLYCAVC